MCDVLNCNNKKKNDDVILESSFVTKKYCINSLSLSISILYLLLCLRCGSILLPLDGSTVSHNTEYFEQQNAS